MFAKVMAATVVGLDGVLVEVETDILSGLPALNLVGLPDKAVEESKERVRSAIINTGAFLPARRITVNLAPADLPKEGPSFDLPIAVSILIASEQLKADITNSLFLGELSLDGRVRHIKGVLPMVLFAKEKGIKNVFLPEENINEARIIEDISLYPVKTLKQLFLHLTGQKEIQPAQHLPYENLIGNNDYQFDMSEIKGQEFAKRAFEIAAAGAHNILLKGPPGAGKTFLARALPSILPPLSFNEAIEVTKLYSISGLLENTSIMTKRPFRSPHHTTSHVGLIGGSANPKPGEISLAHRGVLFLDEFPEFSRYALETMRQPMEDGSVVISRARERVVFPCRFMLVAALNPCPCGYFGDKTRSCTCISSQIIKYQKKISGPMLDRIDIHVEVPAVKMEKITGEDDSQEETSESIRKRVNRARIRQKERFIGTKLVSNSEMGAKEIKQLCKIDPEAFMIAKSAIVKLGLSARSYHKLIKVAQTISDLESAGIIQKHHVLEALQYRSRSMMDNH